MDDSGSVFQTLAGALSGGLSAYYDSQNTQPVYPTQPTPQTAYGTAGVAQPTSGSTIGGLSPTMLLLVGVAIVAVVLLKK